MASVFDVAAYVLQRQGPTSGKKLQKLVYYCQAWSLAWTSEPLFFDQIEAWRDGPVTPSLFQQHKYSSLVERISGGDPRLLNAAQVDTIDSVLAFYGNKTAEELVQLTHEEPPWRNARRGLLEWHSGSNAITHQAMQQYYSGLNKVH